MPPADIMRKRADDLRKYDRAEFIRSAALIILQSLPVDRLFRPLDIAENARLLYEAVQDEIMNEDKE